ECDSHARARSRCGLEDQIQFRTQWPHPSQGCPLPKKDRPSGNKSVPGLAADRVPPPGTPQRIKARVLTARRPALARDNLPGLGASTAGPKYPRIREHMRTFCAKQLCFGLFYFVSL